MKNLIEKMNTKREGATLVTVVIATAFMIAIGVVILAASTKYLASVYMDRNSNENLYSTEGILAEVKAGLMEFAGDSAADAYQEVVESYEAIDASAEGSPGVISMKDKFSQMFLSKFITKLRGMAWTWDESKVVTLPISSEVPLDPEKTIPKSKLEGLTKHPEAISTKAMLSSSLAGATGPAVDAVSGGAADLRFEIYKSSTKGYFLTIQNLVIDYTDDGGYRSTISTDIQITVPDYRFDGDDTLDTASKFLVVSDGKLKVGTGALKNTGSEFADGTTYTSDGETEFIGNIYTGGYVGSRASAVSGVAVSGDIIDDAPGIEVDANMAARFNCELLISRGSLEAKTGSHVSILGAKEYNPSTFTRETTKNGEAYLKNIRLVPSNASFVAAPAEGKGTELTLRTNAYIENDLDIQDAGSTVLLGGRYYGYSYSKENDAATEVESKSQADYSSAILVNGFGTRLLVRDNDLDSLQLAGRSYVSRDTAYRDYNDIMMGESLAVKSNQIAYLVPDMFIKEEFQHNPVTATEADWNGVDYYNPVTLIKKDEMMKPRYKLYQYLDPEHPVIGNYKPAKVSGGESYVFLFLNFKDQDSANKYFRDLYSGEFYTAMPDSDDEDEIEDWTGSLKPSDLSMRSRAYITSKDGDIKIDSTLFNIAGNIVRYWESGSLPGVQPANYFDGDDPLKVQQLMTGGRQIGIRYVNLQRTLTTSGDAETGYADSMRLVNSNRSFLGGSSDTQTEVDPLVYKKLVRGDQFSNLPEMAGPKMNVSDIDNANIYVNGSGGVDITPAHLGQVDMAGGYGTCLIVANGDVSINEACAGLIIANGSVRVNKNFRGLILATGDVDVQQRVTMESSPVLAKKLLEYAKSDTNPDSNISILFGGATPDPANTSVLERCCRYMNWEKNMY